MVDTDVVAGRTYAYEVSTLDMIGNESPRSRAISITTPQAADVTAPSVPNALRGVAKSSSTIHLAWEASSDDTGVTGYRVSRNGVEIATVTNGTSYVDTGLKGATSYSYSVAAVDAAGNRSRTASLSVSTKGSGRARAVR
jgi:chitodextrinase